MFFNKKILMKLVVLMKIFLYFEENDFCIRALQFNKNFQINSINVTHDGGNSVSIKNNEEKIIHDNFRTWHFMWSKFYFYKKKYNFYIAFIYFIPILIRLFFKNIFSYFV